MLVKRLRDTAAGLWSLLVGLKVTAWNIVQPQITIHYPREVSPTLEGFRGHIELVPSEDDPYKSKCIACGNCVRECPSSCITMKSERPQKKETEQEQSSSGDQEQSGEKKEAKGKKPKPVMVAFRVDFNYCSLCGQCVAICPSGALRFSQNYYLAGFSREEFDIDLVARLQSKAKEQ